ncbi:hypothetical protein Nepgr_001842 [Nepenthes gracilis]|uniref:Uncharacterized protein n=1 Tax=Nepenthes gracilis TaxID=150966 RepID=A0AAD3RXW8_NEPGR|nr:hypothetical protein Nepgr_001842 [Nepenthes gracilis]
MTIGTSYESNPAGTAIGFAIILIDDNHRRERLKRQRSPRSGSCQTTCACLGRLGSAADGVIVEPYVEQNRFQFHS